MDGPLKILWLQLGYMRPGKLGFWTHLNTEMHWTHAWVEYTNVMYFNDYELARSITLSDYELEIYLSCAIKAWYVHFHLPSNVGLSTKLGEMIHPSSACAASWRYRRFTLSFKTYRQRSSERDAQWRHLRWALFSLSEANLISATTSIALSVCSAVQHVSNTAGSVCQWSYTP